MCFYINHYSYVAKAVHVQLMYPITTEMLSAFIFFCLHVSKTLLIKRRGPCLYNSSTSVQFSVAQWV